MVLKVFKIILDYVSPEHEVHPTGIPLTGHVLVETDRTEDYEEIRVTLTGKGEVEWKEEVGTGDERRTEEYDAKEKYIKEKVVVWNKKNDPDGCFSAGEHTFPFQFTIPAGSPSSFKSHIGEIQYKIKAKIEQPGKDDKIKQTIKVVDAVDADLSNLQEPVQREKTKSVGFLCCAAGDVTYTMELAKTGFNIKGDKIPIQFHIENGSSKDINMQARLFQNIKYSADGHQRYEHNKILEENSPVIAQHSTIDWATTSLSIPDIAVTTKGSKILEVEYILRVCAEIPYSFDPTVDIPLVIGSANLFRLPS